MSPPGTNFSRSTIFELSTSSAFSSSAVKVTNSPRAYSYPFTTSRLSISSPVAGSCGRSVTRVAAGLWSPSRLASSARSRGADGAEPCCPSPRSDQASSATSTGAGWHTWCNRMDFARVVAGDKYIGQDTKESRRKPRQLARGIANLLDDLVSQQPVPNFCATVSRRVQKDDEPTGSTRVASPIETATVTSPLQRERQRRRVAALRSRAARQSWKCTSA